MAPLVPVPIRAAPLRATNVVRRKARRHSRRRLQPPQSTLSGNPTPHLPNRESAFLGTPWRNNGNCRVDESAFEQVLNWVKFYGGYVHPALTIGYSVATGTRGILATDEIPESDLESGPLMAIPDMLRINAAVSQQRLQPTIDLCDLPPLEDYSDNLQTSLLLAFEKKKGAESFWSAYIETLPETPSSAWLLPESDLRIELALLPSHNTSSEDWLETAKLHIQAYQHELQEAVGDYGDALGIDIEDLRWAMGHVHSHAYGADCSMIPVVDLINHNAQAMPPLGLMSDDQMPMTFVGSFYKGFPRTLQPGNELFINYSFPKGVSPLSLFLDFGFLPQECLTPQVRPGRPHLSAMWGV